MTPQRVFQTMTDEQLSEMSLSLIAGTITRDDYHRLCCWLDAGIRMSDYTSGDSTIDLLMSLGGAVTHTQRELLKAAMRKWMGIIQTYILDTENNTHKVAGNPVQMAFDFTGERQARAVVAQVMGYGNTPVNKTEDRKFLGRYTGVVDQSGSYKVAENGAERITKFLQKTVETINGFHHCRCRYTDYVGDKKSRFVSHYLRRGDGQMMRWYSGARWL